MSSKPDSPSGSFGGEWVPSVGVQAGRQDAEGRTEVSVLLGSGEALDEALRQSWAGHAEGGVLQLDGGEQEPKHG